MEKTKEETQKNNKNTYTIKDAMKVTDDIFNLSKEKDYHPGAFIHGLIFALEYVQSTYKIPKQQIAQIKRDCKQFFNEMGPKKDK